MSGDAYLIRKALGLGRAHEIALAIADNPTAHELAVQVAAAKEPFDEALQAIARMERAASEALAALESVELPDRTPVPRYLIEPVWKARDLLRGPEPAAVPEADAEDPGAAARVQRRGLGVTRTRAVAGVGPTTETET